MRLPSRANVRSRWARGIASKVVSCRAARAERSRRAAMSYLNIVEVETAIANLAMAYPSLCQLIPLPNTSFEMRSSNAIRLGSGAPGSRDVVMIICGQHAREWGSCEIGVDFAADLLE